MSTDRDYVALKFNGNFPDNRRNFGFPTIQGAILLCDGASGALLAVLDSIEVTLRRTAAASALAARLLARPQSGTLLVCGCGEQGRAHVAALEDVLPLDRCLLWDSSGDAVRAAADTLRGRGSMKIEVIEDLSSATAEADVIVTCTTAREPFLKVEHVRPGTFVAAVGADNPDKSELTPELLSKGRIVVDTLAQCATMGDLHHAIAAGLVKKSDVHAELVDVVAGSKPGRQSPDEILIFDSTGTALEDVAAAAMIYERCRADETALRVSLGAS